MELGIFAKTFVRPSVEEVFDAVRDCGVSCFQFNMACAGLAPLPERIDPALAARIGEAARERGLTMAAVSGTFNLIHPDGKTRAEGLRRLGELAAACKHLGTSIITLCTGTRDSEDMWRAHPENASRAAWQDLREAIAVAVEMAEANDLTLAFEPERVNVVSSAKLARRLLDEVHSDRLKVVIDPANLIAPEDVGRMSRILDDAFALLGGAIVLAHAKELRTGASLDWPAYINHLRRYHFGGPLILHGCTEAEAGAELARLRAVIGAS